jgi:ferredoxin
MRIVVDLDLCQGHGVCESEAPSVFVVEKGAESVTILAERPGPEVAEEVALAIEYCPTRAIRIIEEEGE